MKASKRSGRPRSSRSRVRARAKRRLGGQPFKDPVFRHADQSARRLEAEYAELRQPHRPD